ncbi:proline racemase [Parashewanella spongiae]|uniref:trans-L-3-hydroxyproline dehydratase n=1 Tax=Parashewanella spongiae TaxID=342950 RepID=A0A3A6TH42_9GAMM|nr:proline racemase family protein [Parashewanella spongiae]MCL1079330.1 proline racemase family protein [Parashewanella spongiae]RJY06879.1 proline racemase [Parashewanella spongiae]
MDIFQISDSILHGFNKITTLDAHTEGEPLRIITSGFPEIKGKTILEKRQYVTKYLDWYRKVLMFEPRGHADMYGAIITEPVTPDADFGVLFLHNEGYSSMCGHAILAIVKVACQTGAIKLNNEPRIVKIDAPAGLVVAKAQRNIANEILVSFENVLSWPEALDCSVYVEGIGDVKYDIGFGGAYYAFVDADEYGISCEANNVAQLIDAGRKIKQAVMASRTLDHPVEHDLSFLYGTIFTSKKVSHEDYHSKHVCVFADGEVDRSPTGTGVSARIALLYEKGSVALNEKITIESIVGGKMNVSALSESIFYGKKCITPEVSGRSYITGQHQFLVDKEDIFQNGFLVR